MLLRFSNCFLFYFVGVRYVVIVWCDVMMFDFLIIVLNVCSKRLF